MPFAVGGRIGRYDLLEHLGEGGQGSVWRVRDVVPPHHERALKIVSLKTLSPTALSRLRREADLLKRLHHPALVRCHGLFESYEEDVVGVARVMPARRENGAIAKRDFAEFRRRGRGA